MKNIPFTTYSVKEEVGNTLTHGSMALLMLLFLPYASIRAYLYQDAKLAFGVSTFIISLFLMFLMSTLYHSMASDTKHKAVFKILDHIFIYVAIAGSYTPVALSIIGGTLGWVIFAIQWTMVIIGVLYKSLSRKSVPALSLLIYMVMGWLVVLIFPYLYRQSNLLFLGLMALGGVLYTVGAFFYIQKNKPYTHVVWHIFVNLASIAHFVAIVFFI
ncbi:MAG: hemolysin III family protein [Erysipelothrix sp.]|jgi:hemolysin III|nr:hemolysin III family protein [Erysipelothrix sp.]